MISEQRAARAFLRAQRLDAGSLTVEVRQSPPTSDPRCGSPVAVPPLVILWVEDRPLAVLLRGVVATSTMAQSSRLGVLVAERALAAGLPIEHLSEAALWRLFSRRQRSRIARTA
jgi:hypothetical protein